MAKRCRGCGDYIGKDEYYVAIPIIDPHDPHLDTYEFYHLECLPDDLKAEIISKIKGGDDAMEH